MRPDPLPGRRLPGAGALFLTGRHIAAVAAKAAVRASLAVLRGMAAIAGLVLVCFAVGIAAWLAWPDE